MEQQIRFCKTSDGVRIAYATVGQGPPLVRALGWFSHLEYEWENLRWHRAWGGLAARYTLTRYDGRGMGLSDRAVRDFSVDTLVRDLEAVVDALGHEKVALYGVSQGGPVAITYAVRHPERVSRLILYGTCGRFPFTSEQYDTMLSLIRQGWGSDLPAHRQFFTSLFMPDGDMEAIQAFNEMQRVSASADNVVGLLVDNRDFDVTHLLPKMTVPTLVIHRRGDAIVPFEFGRELAAGIPGARFLPLDGRNHSPLSDIDLPARALMVKCMGEFVGGGDKATEAAAAPLPEGMAVILFTDIVGSTALTEQLGDSAFRAKARELDTSLRSVIREAGGAPVECRVLGDGVMAVFTSARQAIDCALRCNIAAQDIGLSLHLGIHAGDVIREGNTVYGGAVNIAARIAGASAAGELLVSDIVRGLARTSANVVFEDRGEQALKGVGEPQRLFAVRGEVV